MKSHDSPASRSPGKNQRPVARAACRPGPSARMGRLWFQPHKAHIKAGHPANISFKPSPLRGLGHTGPQRAGRLNSGVRRRQTKIFSTWGSPAKRHRHSQVSSATYSVQLESSCTPSVGKLSREKPAGAQNQFCAAGSGCPSIRGLPRSARNSSLVSRLTIRSSRVRFAASSRCGKLVHLAAAATLLGLAQALGLQ